MLQKCSIVIVRAKEEQLMSLLRDIQAVAIDSTVPLTTLLRKCKVLVARLGNAEFKQWVASKEVL